MKRYVMVTETMIVAWLTGALPEREERVMLTTILDEQENNIDGPL